MKLIVAVLAALAGSASGVFHEAKKNVRNNMGEHRVVTIGRKHLTEEVNNLLLSHDADHFGSHHEEGSHFKITPEAKRALESMGVELEDSTEKWLSHFEENYNTEGFICAEGTDACAKRDLQAFYSSYQTLAAIHARMDTIAASSSVATVGSIGTSFQGRDLKVMNIGDQSKPLVFYFCNIHAREWLTPMYCTYMAETLAAGHPLLNNFSFTILPSANPDGYVYSVTTNNQWRKTRKPATTGSTCIGTDPNRNYPINHCGTGSSTNACSETYCGAAPFDQPETAAIRNFGLANANRMIAMNDVHAYSQLWMSPYAWTNTLPPAVDFNKQQSCNKAAVDAIRATTNAVFTYGPIYSTIYPASGGAVDYFYDVINVVYAYTAELRGTSFQPATSNIMPSNLEIFAAMSASLQCIAGLEGIGGGAAPSAPPVLPTPAPVPAPTPGCADLVPSGIVYSGSGAPAPCSELRSYCSAYDFVRQRCPVTCGTCAQAANFKGTSSDIKTVNKVTYTYVAVGFAAFLVAGVAAVVVMRKRVQKTGPAETAIVSDANVSENKVEAAKVEKVVATSGKDAPKDMYDV